MQSAPSLPGRGIASTAYQAPEVHLCMNAAPKLSPDTANQFSSGPKMPYSALLSGESGELIQRKCDDSKEGGKSAIYDKREKWDMATAPTAGLKILSDNEQHIKTSEKSGLFQSSSQATGSEKTYSDLESPSSPFEVLVGKTEFSNFSADSSGHGGQAGAFAETGWHMNSWSNEPYTNSGARTAGDFLVGPPSYESVTSQATAVESLDFQGLRSPVVSDCDMNSKVFSADYLGQLNDSSRGFQRAGHFALSAEVMQKIPPYQIEQDHIHCQLGNAEDAGGYSREKVPEMPNEALQLGYNLAKEVLTEAECVTRSRTHLSEDSSFIPQLLNSFETADSDWPDTAEMAEADSSGESDDTVIEDTKASLTLVGKKAEAIESPEKEGEPAKSGSKMMLGENNLSAPLNLVLVPNQVVESESSPEELAYHEKSRLPFAIPEEDSEFIDDFETIQNPVTDIFDEKELSEQAKSIKELTKPGVQKLETPCTLSEFSRASPVEVLLREDEQSVKNKESFFLSFDKTAKASGHHNTFDGENFIDFRNKWNAKSSTDLAQVNEANVDAGTRQSSTDLHIGGCLFKKLPLAETGMEGHGTFSQVGELANKYISHGGTFSGVKLQPSPASPEAAAFFLNLNQEQLTIAALRELSTIPDESPVSAEESLSPSPKENSTFMTADQREEAFAPFSETITKISPIQEEVDVACSFPSTQFLQKYESQKVSSDTKELTKEQGFARLLMSCSVRDLVFWRDVKKSGMVFVTSLVLLLSLAAFSVISVIAYLILAFLSVTISFRVYRSVIQAVQKSEEGHPFKPWLDVDVSVSSEAFHNHVNTSLVYVNKALKQVIRLFLVQDLVDSLKLAVCMWLMTYVGAVFNGITLLILGLLMAFTIPIVYEKYQTQIDHYISIIRDQSKAILAKLRSSIKKGNTSIGSMRIHAKLPGLAKKKAE